MLLPSIVITFCVTVIFLLALRPLAINAGLVDRPGGRKQHIGVVPIIGGVAMFAGLLAGASLGGLNELGASPLAAGALLVAIGALDDKYPVPAGVRLGAQLAAVLILFYGGGIRVESLGDTFGFGTIELGVVTLPVTILIAISVINAFNLVDGADGLAGTMGVLALAPAALVAGFESAHGALAILAVAAIVGFLCFNYPLKQNRRIRTFMGDAGSTLVGLLVFACVAALTQGAGAEMSPVVGLWLVAVPVFDLFTCFVRRSIKGHSPFKPGRDHFHHVLARGGFSMRESLGFLTLLQVFYLAIGLACHFLAAPDVVVFASWSAVGLSQWWLIRRFAALARHERRSRTSASGLDEAASREAA